MSHGSRSPSSRQSLAALLPTASQRQATTGRPHADQEPVRALTVAVVGLERPLHHGPPGTEASTLRLFGQTRKSK